MRQPQKKGWFKIQGVQDGDRTIEQQMKGLGILCAEAANKTVLDLGCAEGLVGMRLISEHGASAVDGLSLVRQEVETGERLAMESGLCMRLHCVNLNDAEAWCAENRALLRERYDIVLMLAILHKLKAPLACLDFVVREFGPELMVIRTAEATPGYVQDTRSGSRRFDVVAHLKGRYTLEKAVNGPLSEWTGYFRRV